VSGVRAWRIARACIGVAAGGAIVWAVIKAWPVAQQYLVPRPLLFAVVLALSIMGCLAGAASWAVLIGGVGARMRPFIAFIASQPAKYLPLGGAMQFATVVDLSTEEGAARRGVAATFVLHALICVSAACALGSLEAVNPIEPSRRMIIACGLLAWLMLLPSVRALLERVLARGPRFLHVALTRSTSRFALSFLWVSVSFVLGATCFTLLLVPHPQGSDLLVVVPAFILAWGAGFVALPFPSGIGVRELVLALLIPGHPAAAIMAASLAQRCVVLIAELVLMAITWRRAYASRAVAPPPEARA
jgi:hypothetical protein